LYDAYSALVAVELALKDGGFKHGQGGHDVPAMLWKLGQFAALNGHTSISAQLAALETQLRNDLTSLICTGLQNTPTPVPANSYPHMRYTRCIGDWGGTSETIEASLSRLLFTCNNIIAQLRANGVAFGVQI
jgi:hypothetical protein